MVQTYQSPVRVYQYPFEFLMRAYERRFPTCPQIPIVVKTEIVREILENEGAEHIVERKCTLNIDAPYLLKKVTGVDYVYFTQTNHLNKAERNLKITAGNLSFTNRLIINETCSYYAHPDNSNWTCFEQSASLNVVSFFGFESTVEKIAVKHYGANIEKGKEIMQFFIDQLFEEGIKPEELPRWRPKGVAPSQVCVAPLSAVHEEEQRPASPADSAIEIKSTTATNSTIDEKKESATVMRQALKIEIAKNETQFRPRKSSIVIKRQPSHTGEEEPELQDIEERLSETYISQYLGTLTTLEQSRLCELKYCLQEKHSIKHPPSDEHLLRFLRARNFDVTKAREMIYNSLLWRKQHNVDKILKNYKPPEIIQSHVSGAWHHTDNANRPLFVLRVGSIDIKGLIRTVGSEELIKYALWLMEQGLVRCGEMTKQLKQPVSSWALLIDLDGLSMRHLWRPGIAALKELIAIAEANYPETLGCMIVTRAPRIFPILWTLIAAFIDENTRNKIHIHAGERPPTMDTLSHYMPKEYIPDFLGGTALCEMPDGGIIAKSEYKDLSDPTQQKIGLANLYTSAYAYKGIPHEVIVPVRDSGAMLTWDFDILKGRVEFGIFLVPNKFIRPSDGSQSPGTLGMLSAAVKSDQTGEKEHPLNIDRHLKLGADVTCETPSTSCSEGDSMQGSHVCNKTGTYVLQWKTIEVPASQQQHSETARVHGCERSPSPPPGSVSHRDSTGIDWSLHTNKSKLMYHYEIIASTNFKGSCASLENCRNSLHEVGKKTPVYHAE